MRYFLVLAVSLSFVSASCGDDESTLSKAQFIERANALCAEANATVGRIVGEVFGSSSPDPNDLQQAFEELIAASRQLHTELAALRPPADMSSEVRDMLAAFAAANDAAQAQGSPAFWESEEDLWATANATAAELGLDACS
jgi:hypothetical protein